MVQTIVTSFWVLEHNASGPGNSCSHSTCFKKPVVIVVVVRSYCNRLVVVTVVVVLHNSN